MNSAVEVLVLHGPQVAGIWLVLLTLAGAALTGLAVPRDVRRPRHLRAWLVAAARAPRLEADRRTAEAVDAARYAGEIAVATQRAAVTAGKLREQWHDAEQAVGDAWEAYLAADAALRRAGSAAAFGAPVTDRSPAQYAEREEFLHRAATAACRRGELSIGQLNDALAHRGGWSPLLHPVEQQLVLARAAAAHRLAAYQRSSAAERAAWQAADVAGAALRALRQEATTASVDAGLLRERTLTVRRRPAPAVTGRPAWL
jgi:hypothetical protein